MQTRLKKADTTASSRHPLMPVRTIDLSCSCCRAQRAAWLCLASSRGQAYLAWIAHVPDSFCPPFAKRSAGLFGGVVAGFVQSSLCWPGSRGAGHYGNLPAVLAWFLSSSSMIALALYPGLACAVTGVSVRRAAGYWCCSPFVWVTTEFFEATPRSAASRGCCRLLPDGHLRVIQIPT